MWLEQVLEEVVSDTASIQTLDSDVLVIRDRKISCMNSFNPSIIQLGLCLSKFEIPRNFEVSPFCC